MDRERLTVHIPIILGIATILTTVVMGLASQYQPVTQRLRVNPFPLILFTFVLGALLASVVVTLMPPLVSLKIKPLVWRLSSIAQIGVQRTTQFAFSSWGRRGGILLLIVSAFSLLYTVSHNLWSFVLLGIVLLSGYWVFVGSLKAAVLLSSHEMGSNDKNADFTILFSKLAEMRAQTDYGSLTKKEFSRRSAALLKGANLQPHHLQRLEDDLGLDINITTEGIHLNVAKR